MERIGIVGGGLMGAGIAEVAARAGCHVVVRESDDARARDAERRVQRSLDRAVTAGKLDDADAVFDRVVFTSDGGALADRQLVVEAVPEDRTLKTSVFAELDQVVEDLDAILASNTSSIPIMQLAMTTQRPEHVLGLHFFNPVPVLPLVELVKTLTTDPAVAERASAFASTRLGKTVIVAKDRAGFVVNALLIPYILSAIRMYESGFASRDDIDAGMVKGCAHPMGPLALADLIGLDTMQSVAEALYAEFRDPACAPPALLSRMVEAGLLGRKTGRGFYEYASP